MNAKLRNRLYYGAKPFLPKRMRIAVRGWIARKMEPRLRGVWPVYPGSEVAPRNWPGWPDGKRFAFLVTHDVEGPRGLERVQQMMDVDSQYGIVSSFNFVPEGSYTVTSELLEAVVGAGFEVGVHDLHHDGKLYDSEEIFVGYAKKINGFLQSWQAVGFRSGFMMNRLDWLHRLNILYDSSTFDTDPFEPQPEGVNTIFPFRVCGNHGNRYLELPYTLPQDSTLYLLLRHKTSYRWKDKLRWIIAHGGMALVNVHPDYVSFESESGEAFTYPVELYEEFLNFVTHEYRDQFWNGLPRELATYADSVLSEGT